MPHDPDDGVRILEPCLGGASRACIAAFAAASLLLTSCGEGDPEPPSGSRNIAIATTGGAELPAIEVGSGGRVVVLSHGATGTKEDFFGLAGVFAEDGMEGDRVRRTL